MSRHLLLQACALHKLRSILVMYPQLSCKHLPPEVGYCSPILKEHPLEMSAPRAWWLDITHKLSQFGWKPTSNDQCLWCRYSDDRELKGVQHVARFAWHSVLEGSANVSSVCCRCELAFECYGSARAWCKIFWTPTIDRDLRRGAAQSLHFHSFNETPWQQLVFASWADASDRPRPDGSRTGGYVITLATEELFGHGQEDDVSVMSWRSFKLPRKCWIKQW